MKGECRNCKFYKIKIVDYRSFICVRQCFADLNCPINGGKDTVRAVRILRNNEKGCDKFESKENKDE